MFYYYLIITGIIANAYVMSYKEGVTAIAIALAVIGVITSLASILLDMRNREMVVEGETILLGLEDVIFPQGRGSNGSSVPTGPLAQETKNQMRAGLKRPWWKSIRKHTVCFRLIAGVVALCFILGAVRAIFKPWPAGPANTLRGNQDQSESWERRQSSDFRPELGVTPTHFTISLPHGTGGHTYTFHNFASPSDGVQSTH